MNLNIIPAAVEAAAHDLAALGTSLTEANAAAAFPTTSILPAGADEVSAAIAELFSGHGQIWQDLQAQARAFHQQFVETLQAADNLYREAEQAIADELAPLPEPSAPPPPPITRSGPPVFPFVSGNPFTPPPPPATSGLPFP